MNVEKVASAILNDILGGLAGYEATLNISLEQLEDEVVEERLSIIKKYSMKNLIPKKDLMYSLNCIEVDCKDLSKCCVKDSEDIPVAHFEIPQIVNDFGDSSIEYIGSTDKQVPFKIYTSPNFRYHKFRRIGKKRPYVYIDTTPNEHNFYDCYLFNAPLLERVSIIAIFKDPRQVEQLACCNFTDADNFTWLTNEIKNNLVNKKLNYYRNLYPQPQQNDLVPR